MGTSLHFSLNATGDGCDLKSVGVICDFQKGLPNLNFWVLFHSPNIGATNLTGPSVYYQSSCTKLSTYSLCVSVSKNMRGKETKKIRKKTIQWLCWFLATTLAPITNDIDLLMMTPLKMLFSKDNSRKSSCNGQEL